MIKATGEWINDEFVEFDGPDFDEVASGLEPGVYWAGRLNPPSGDDCTHLLVHDDGMLSWCNADGVDTTASPEQRFTARSLCDDA